MDSVVHSHSVYKSVWLPVIEEQFVLGRSLPTNPHNELPVAVIAKGLSFVDRILLEKIFIDHVVFYYMKSSVVSYCWGKEERKMLRSAM